MRILLIRHGDPDYEHDTLTEKGRREAELLAKRASSLAMGSCYQYHLGRAMDTAQRREKMRKYWSGCGNFRHSWI